MYLTKPQIRKIFTKHHKILLCTIKDIA